VNPSPRGRPPVSTSTEAASNPPWNQGVRQPCRMPGRDTASTLATGAATADADLRVRLGWPGGQSDRLLPSRMDRSSSRRGGNWSSTGSWPCWPRRSSSPPCCARRPAPSGSSMPSVALLGPSRMGCSAIVSDTNVWPKLEGGWVSRRPRRSSLPRRRRPAIQCPNHSVVPIAINPAWCGYGKCLPEPSSPWIPHERAQADIQHDDQRVPQRAAATCSATNHA
jgi:hypothetical protein